MKTIAVANQKGGCGKTTTTINLAGCLASSGKKILVIDLDPQAHASFGLGMTTQVIDRSIYNVLTDAPEKKRSLSECILKRSGNMDMITSNILLSTLEQELKDKDDAVSRLYQAITTSILDYDYCLIDCPPSLGFLTFNALRAADHVLVPIDMSAFSLMGVSKLLGMLELIKIKISHAPAVNALATIFDKRTKYSQVILNEIKSLFRDQLLETIIRMSVSLKKAAAGGVTVVEFDKESNGAVDYMALAHELLKQDVAEKFEKALEEAGAAPEGVPVERVRSESAETPAVTVTASAEPVAVVRFQPVETAPETPPEASSIIKEALFTLDAPSAREIYVVGDFNQWKLDDSNRLYPNPNGRWEKRLALQPGKYRYKFVVDGEWKVDEGNNDKEQNIFGTFDSVVSF